MNLSSRKKSNRTHLVQLSSFPDQFIVSPARVYRRVEDERDKAGIKGDEDFKFLNVGAKNIDLRWNIKGNPNGSFSRPGATREQLGREDTFDQDFMMPTRVREVLLSEGLESVVIDNTIGNSERKHKRMSQLIEEEQRLKDRRSFPKSYDLSPMANKQRHNPGSPGPRQPVQTSVSLDGGPFSLAVSPGGTRRDRRDQKPKPWTDTRFRKVEDADDDVEPPPTEDVEDATDCAEREEAMQQWKSEQHMERLFVGAGFTPARIALVSSKVTKCHLLSQVFQEEGVLPIQYDFDTWSCADMIDAVTQRLDNYRRRSKARSILILCQGGPGHIYLLRNFVITPQKLHKPSYRSVVEFWKALGGLISKLNVADAAIHILGFKLTDSEQGTQLLSMIQKLMLPSVVRIEAPLDETREGRDVAELYFKYNRYRTWKMHQNTSVTDIDFHNTEDVTDIGATGFTPGTSVSRRRFSSFQ